MPIAKNFPKKGLEYASDSNTVSRLDSIARAFFSSHDFVLGTTARGTELCTICRWPQNHHLHNGNPQLEAQVARLVAVFQSIFVIGFEGASTYEKGNVLMNVPLLCLQCGVGRPTVTKEDIESGDLDFVTCPLCGCKTDLYEAAKAVKGKE